MDKDITEEERNSITNDMILVADKIAELDLRNKKFLDRLGTKIMFGILAVGAMVGAGIGIKSALGSSGDLPQISDDDSDGEYPN